MPSDYAALLLPRSDMAQPQYDLFLCNISKDLTAALVVPSPYRLLLDGSFAGRDLALGHVHQHSQYRQHR